MFDYLEILNHEERKAFEKLYKENRNRMYRLAFAVLNHHEDSENAVQDAFISLAENYEKYKRLDASRLMALCNTVVKNKAIDILRKKISRSECVLEEKIAISEEEEVESIIVRQEEQDEVRDLLAQVDSITRQILILKYFVGYKNADIAKTLKVSKRVVEMRLHRVKQKLRPEYKKE